MFKFFLNFILLLFVFMQESELCKCYFIQMYVEKKDASKSKICVQTANIKLNNLNPYIFTTPSPFFHYFEFNVRPIVLN